MFLKRQSRVTTNSPEETFKLGSRVVSELSQGDVVFLYGDLGSGKTVLVKGMCRGLGVKENVTSSSFVVATEYQGRMPIAHIDLYRLARTQVSSMPIEEYFMTDGITVIEWAERIEAKTYSGVKIYIQIIDHTKREFRLEDTRS